MKARLVYKIGEEAQTQSRVVVWLVQGGGTGKKGNIDSTMLESGQQAVDFCPQASQSDRAHETNTENIQEIQDEKETCDVTVGFYGLFESVMITFCK